MNKGYNEAYRDWEKWIDESPILKIEVGYNFIEIKRMGIDKLKKVLE